MGINTSADYVKFYINLGMRDSVTLQSFVNNEKMILKGKLENKNWEKERVLKGIMILDDLTKEIIELGEKGVLEKYGK